MQYQVTVSAAGFRTEVHEGITLQVAQRATARRHSTDGKREDIRESTAEVPIVNTEDAVYGDVIENKRVVELPLNGRNFNSLALLTPNIHKRSARRKPHCRICWPVGSLFGLMAPAIPTMNGIWTAPR